MESTEEDTADRTRQVLLGLIRGCPDLVGVISLDASSLLFVNDVARETVGFGGRDPAGVSVSEVLSEKEIRRFVEEIWPAVLADGRWEGEVEARHLQTGERVPLQVSSFTVASHTTGETIGVGSIGTDLRREDARSETARLARNLLEALLRDFAADAADLARSLRGLAEESSALDAALVALRESEARFRILHDNAPAMCITVDATRTIVSINRSGAEQLGYAPAELIGRALGDLILERDRDRVLEHVARCIAQPGPMAEAEMQALRNDGRAIWLKAVARGFVCVDGAPAALIMGEDIGERRRLESELLEVSAREQRRFANDLHDGLGQRLTGIAFLSQALSRGLRSKGLADEAGRAAEIGKLVDAAIAEARDLARGLCPIDLGHEGALGSALDDLCRSVEKIWRVRCRFEGDRGLGLVDDATATQLYFVAREALHNAVAHGAPKELRVRLDAGEDEVHLAIADDGIGFVVPRRPEGNGMGLRIMDYRARLVGGTLEVRSEPGEGTTVLCSVPARCVARGLEARTSKNRE